MSCRRGLGHQQEQHLGNREMKKWEDLSFGDARTKLLRVNDAVESELRTLY